jgi:hypothetical protein
MIIASGKILHLHEGAGRECKQIGKILPDPHAANADAAVVFARLPDTYESQGSTDRRSTEMPAGIIN